MMIEARHEIQLEKETIKAIYEIYDTSLLKHRLKSATLIEDKSWEQEMYPNDKDFGAEVRNLIRVNNYLITKIKDTPLD